MGTSLLFTGEIARGRGHYDQAIALYDPAEHRPLAMRFGQDVAVAILSFRSLALWLLGYPDAALADTERALKDAREIGQAVTLMYALTHVAKTYFHRGDYAVANAQADELVALADEKGALLWKYAGMIDKGYVLAMTGKASNAIQIFTSAITGHRSTGSRIWVPLYSSYLARAYAELGQYEQARHSIDEAMAVVETTKERWCEAEINRIAGQIALMLPDQDGKKAEAYFERALTIARAQQAKSWELRAAMSMARLWRDQGEQRQAHDLLAPIYGWFTEGFDTLDLKDAKALLEQLKA